MTLGKKKAFEKIVETCYFVEIKSPTEMAFLKEKSIDFGMYALSI